LDLAGAVDAAHFGPLLAGDAPLVGSTQVRPPQRRLAALDLTFCAPKSVSLVHALAPAHTADGLKSAHHAAVEDVLDYLERHACVVRRGERRDRAEGFVAATFLHRTSRSADPHLHTHAVVVNTAEGPDRRWTALLTPLLFAEVRTASALYHAALRHNVTQQLGLSWGRVIQGRAELAGVDRGVIAAFSRRHLEIQERRRRQERLSSRWAATLTRPPQHGLVDYAALRRAWVERADHVGFDVTRALRGRTMADRLAPAPHPRAVMRELSLRGAPFSRADVARTWAERSAMGATVATIEARVEETLCSPEVRRTGPSIRDGVRRLDGPDGPEPMFMSRRSLGRSPSMERDRDLRGLGWHR
jgi:conjugative relaxase-like TrwC/TraI family protein